MDGFTHRMTIAEKHEARVRRSLARRGWVAEKFGQAQLSAEMRAYLKRTRTPVRWLPDIIAARSGTALTRVVFIDAKGGDKHKETGNHAVEIAALDAAEKFAEFAKCELFYVFGDGGVLTPAEVRELGVVGEFRGRGSGTAFLLVSAAVCHSFDAIFPPVDLADAS